MDDILKEVKTMPQGYVFQLKDLTSFNKMRKCERIKNGKVFSANVKSGKVPNVVFVDKDMCNHSIYRVI